MTHMGKGLIPRGVQEKHGRYYRVRAEGKRRVWVPLTRIDEGLAALYAALAELERGAAADDTMPGLVAAWQRDVMSRHAAKTQVDERKRGNVIAQAFADFRAGQVMAPDVAEFLRPLQGKPRTHNLYRAQIRELMRYAVERGFRTDNPVVHLRTVTERPRTRYVTDSELRRVKVAAIRGQGTAGRMLAALLDVMYLTGQRPSDVLALRWSADPDDPDAPHVTAQGLRFRPSKTRHSTGAAVVIEWTPRLRDAIRRLEALRAARLLKKRAEQRVVSGHVFTGKGGRAWSYRGAHDAWRQAVVAASIHGIELRDLRAKALTDKDQAEGIGAAQTMGAHSTQTQTADYVRQRGARRTRAVR